MNGSKMRLEDYSRKILNMCCSFYGCNRHISSSRDSVMHLSLPQSPDFNVAITYFLTILLCSPACPQPKLYMQLVCLNENTAWLIYRY